MPHFDTPEPITATVELMLGDLHVIASDRQDTVVAVNPTDRSREVDVTAAEQTEIEHEAGRVLVRVPKPRGLGKFLGPGRNSGSVDVVIELPAGSHVSCDTAVADVRIDGQLGEVRIATDVGAIRIDRAGPLHAETSTGNVTIDHVIGHTMIKAAGEIAVNQIDGPAEINNLNGSTWVGEVTGGARITSANGDILLDRAHAELRAKTANGTIRIGEVARETVKLETSSGGLAVGIPDGTAAWVDAHSKFGRVHNALDSASGPEPSRETVEIYARTSYGDIDIHRS
ncbi:DUF4097 family beta strand repeat-containing protein [Haloechinothrix sp. LS1_15]|uniref:DUF4097 family beta strand repeat-containing protein n=1 Tax=Haloechinothrix sp. LS1_15 TaxID=2652248 RepID=UPI0029458E7E|nr:DUF4097 family beta strand repeat-containing protein [Haloechinothrix sp. LS1_15]MDV6011015.1 DUF4097 domain-containing protein [Haloechinothrix sp. LS1_15]